MAVATNKLKTRIKSVTGAYKVTSAMKLVSTVKLKKYRNKMLSLRGFNEEISSSLDTILTSEVKLVSPLINENNHTDKNLYIIVTSSLGLCGSYNENIYKICESMISNNDDLIILGNKGKQHFSSFTNQIIHDFDEFNSINDVSIINQLTQFMINQYSKGLYKAVYLISTKYKNPLVFTSIKSKLLPLTYSYDELNKTTYFGPILEPNPQSLFDSLLPLYLKNIMYGKLLESEVCEHASRSNAMENATNNAKDLLDELNIEFNKARQASITQEIVEISTASKSI